VSQTLIALKYMMFASLSQALELVKPLNFEELRLYLLAKFELLTIITTQVPP
jgi:hypothetical protein